MNTRFLAHLNGEDIPAEEACLPVTDLGVAQGIAVTEMLRTFGHQIFRLDEHLGRLKHSLETVGWSEVLMRLDDIADSVVRIAQHNSALIEDGNDLGVNVFVTGGPNPSYLGQMTSEESRRTLGIHTFPLRFERWASSYAEGVRLTVSTVKAMPSDVIDPTIKYRSRLHWYLADQEVANRAPGKKAILIDRHGNLTETSTGNFFTVIDGVLITPPDDKILSGISRQIVAELAKKIGIEVQFRDLQPEEIRCASEALVSSTPYCILPVVEFDGSLVGEGKPGPIFGRLIKEWSGEVGVDIAKQAIQSSVSPRN